MFSIRTAKDDDHRTALHAASDLGLVSNQVLNLGQLIVSSAWSYRRIGDVRGHKRVSCGSKGKVYVPLYMFVIPLNYNPGNVRLLLEAFADSSLVDRTLVFLDNFR